jgi:very-short-patch-repair endonuclease
MRFIRVMDGKGATNDARIAALAARQHGIVTARQLRELGIGRGAVEARLARGALHRVYRGVYAVGHAGLGREAEYTAAVLACGDGAVLSHRSAAELWDLLRPEDGPVHVSLASSNGRCRRDGIRLHRSSFAPGELTRRADIPVTTPSRTILDLRASDLEPRLVRHAIRQAQHSKYRLDPRLEPDRTRSDLELDFTVLCRRHRIPPPEVNVKIGRHTVDFLWRSHALVVETDSYRYHQGSISFEDDRARDLALRRRGLTVLRYTGRQLEREESLVAEEIAAHLAHRRPRHREP